MMSKRIFATMKAWGLTVFYWLWSRTWMVRRINERTEKTPFLYGHWHGDELLLIGAYAGSGMAVMASHSRDGELVFRLLSWLGYRVVRGSSTRGGAGGLKGLIDAVSIEKRDASLAVDGPRGPRFVVKPGIIKLAQQTGRPVIPAGTFAKYKFTFKKSWNQCYLPLPFSPCVILFGEPLFIPPVLTEEQFEICRKKLETELLRLQLETRSFYKTPRLEQPVSGCSAVG